MSASLKWVRRNYNIPAFVGTEGIFQGKAATILGGRGQYVRLLPQGAKRPVITHPTWSITYPTPALPPRPRGWCAHCWEERALRSDGTVGRHLRDNPEHYPAAERPCPGAHDKPWGVCSWTVATPVAEEVAA